MSDKGSRGDPTERPCPFVTFYSFKGGVGRSMAVINVAGIIAARGFQVLVIDMDLEAPGLSFLAASAGAEKKSAQPQPGFVDLLLDAVDRSVKGDLFGLKPTRIMDNYSAPFTLPRGFRTNPGGKLRIMPAGRLDSDYAKRLDRLDLPTRYREGTGLALVKAFKQVVQSARRFDYVLVDSRTGFSDESGICTRDLADCLMVVSGLNRQNVEGTSRFLSALRNSPDERRPLGMILSPIPNGEDALIDQREEEAKAQFKEAWGKKIDTDLHIPYHPQLALTEEPHIFRRRKGYLFDAYNRIEQRLLALLGHDPYALDSRALQAVQTKDYQRALALARRAAMLSDGHVGSEHMAVSVDPGFLRASSPAAKALLDFMVLDASDSTRRLLAERIGQLAISPTVTTTEERETLHKRAIEAEPKHANNLGNYAIFLRRERQDLDGAEALYKRAIDAEPKNSNNLGNYAIFLRRERRDLDGAETLFKRAIEADPNRANSLGNYAHLHLTLGRVAEGMKLVDRALAIREEARSPEAIDAECTMYIYCCGPPKSRPAALEHLRALIETHFITTDDWDFAGVIAQAAKMNHPAEKWLPVLAEVLAGRQDSATLDEWPAWREAGVE